MNSALKRLVLLAFLVPCLGLSACGDDDDTSTNDEPGVDQTSSSETSGSGPEGPLTSGGVGDVTRGATPDDVEEAFGAPASEETAPGCELGGPNAPEVLTWTYDLGDGELIMNFDPAAAELVDYRSTSPSLETSLGDAVGDDFEELSHNWGSDLKPFPLGQPTPEEGIWAVSENEENKLLFDIQGGAITAISGGFVQICD